jgi:tRNA/rRNA methyltransferase
LLFGSEKFGLSNEDLAHCHWLMRIPTRQEHESMNLGQAVAVCLYELIRSEEAASREPIEVQPAAAAEVERFTELLLTLLRESGYINPKTAQTTENKIRRMAYRLHLTARDAYIWHGIWRQILWRLRKDGEPADLSSE